RPACACQIETGHLQGKSVWTVEALAGDAHGVQLLASFERLQAAQCGFCTSGILMRAQALLRETPLPTREAVMAALAPHLCRCGAQPRIIDAVMDATPPREAP
ncbi:MAG: aldehyde oxidase, partial [Comamonadaceae bacterium]